MILSLPLFKPTSVPVYPDHLLDVNGSKPSFWQLCQLPGEATPVEEQRSRWADPWVVLLLHPRGRGRGELASDTFTGVRKSQLLVTVATARGGERR